MTEFQLRQIAHRKGFVRWTPSRRVERVRIAKNGTLLATNLLTGEEHRLYLREDYWCEEIDQRVPVQIGDML